MADILVVTGSPRAGGNTAMLADAFVEGAQGAGNSVVRFDAGRADIKGCLGCNYCFAHEGACCQEDDMQEAYPLLHRCDTLAYVTPIYCFTFSAQIKAFMDRMFCGIAKPFSIKSTVLLTAFEDKDHSISRYMIDTYRALTAYSGMDDKGVVAVGSVFEKGAIAGNPGLEEARKLGASLK